MNEIFKDLKKIGLQNHISHILLTAFFIIVSKKLDLDIIGLMCIPPANESPDKYFQELRDLNLKSNLSDLSMGMSADYIDAIRNGSTFVRIGSSIFGVRS